MQITSPEVQREMENRDGIDYKRSDILMQPSGRPRILISLSALSSRAIHPASRDGLPLYSRVLVFQERCLVSRVEDNQIESLG